MSGNKVYIFCRCRFQNLSKSDRTLSLPEIGQCGPRYFSISEGNHYGIGRLCPSSQVCVELVGVSGGSVTKSTIGSLHTCCEEFLYQTFSEKKPL